MNQNVPCQFFSFEDTSLAVRHRKGRHSPGLVWLHGYQSDMLGSKAMLIDQFAQKHDLSCLRFDYSGHGESEGDFFQGTISRWVSESLAAFETYCEGPQILVGSSMGGWIALRLSMMLAQKNKKLAGMLLIAPAPDFTQTLVEPELGPEEWEILEKKGYIERPAAGDEEPMPFTKKLIEDGRENCVMKGCIDVGCPVHILQGMEDDKIPYQHTLTLLDHLPLHNVTLTLVRDADHRFSRPQDLDCLETALKSLIDQINEK
ncbi:alpha/beta hydrolase [Bartonella krasnovii]|uniref:Palmitoyl-protein thioesterase ABHD10, mitochondrial n=1 Tax=Bartonella krasnovii TaxID=2267275 RepID=A0A5B9D3C3_9HYPH|nr:alpha/beta hydrolase [Bartonella krasnovii]QEE13038.1 alpha/beta hydrolase [Bartonella krasnovii]UNF29156.1 alpha/beta hydrolase [Bartonella krasnovii]UNF35513.1 alpha/beta hydrolase [Bartonella krasnovii]UNF37128.1 alpha/beta hydrolase [Bartonella krasnovii]UNF38828.1 alpha/beta hydrolase [Bartonella krasnovii]